MGKGTYCKEDIYCDKVHLCRWKRSLEALELDNMLANNNRLSVTYQTNCIAEDAIEYM